MGSTGQAAIEYLTVIGIALLVSTPLIIQTQQSSIEVQSAFNDGLVQNALNAVEEAASLVNSQGDPARVTFRIRLPSGINQTNVSDQFLYIQRRTPNGYTDFYNTLEFNVSGDLPEDPGVHRMVAEAEDDYVNITAQ